MIWWSGSTLFPCLISEVSSMMRALSGARCTDAMQALRFTNKESNQNNKHLRSSHCWTRLWFRGTMCLLSCDVCHLLITFAFNNLEPFYLNPNCLTLERIFWKCKFWKRPADDNKCMKNYPVCSFELKFNTGYCRLQICFKINFFKKFFHQYHQSVKQFGSRSGPTSCRAWSGSEMFAKNSQQTTQVGKLLTPTPDIPLSTHAMSNSKSIKTFIYPDTPEYY